MPDHGERSRSNSIFSDDNDNDRWRNPDRDRWRSEDFGWGGDPARGHNQGIGDRSRDDRSRGADEDRGFLSRAGDEVRSWFGDEDAERRRDQDGRRWEQEQGFGERSRGSRGDRQSEDRFGQLGEPRSNFGGIADLDQRSGGQSAPGYGRAQQGDAERFDQIGEAGFRSSGQTGGGSPHDESYRRWRDQQIAQLDSEYDDYCRHRQQQFEQDFSSFRQNRQTGAQQQQAGTPTSGSDTLSAATALAGGSSPDAEAGNETTDAGRSAKAR